MIDPLDALFGAVIDDDGTRWGAIATPEQKADARAVLDPEGERFHMLLRPRGGSKTTDLAAMLAVTLAFQARPSDRLYAFAADRDQARLLHDALAGIVRRTPLLRGLEVGSYVVTAPAGANLQVMTGDAASAFGLLPSWIAVDELHYWPPGHERLWTAITSAMGKRPGSRLTVISAPSSPSHWSHRVYEHAKESEAWRVSHWPGPLPWVDESYLAEQRAALTDAEYRRLHLSEWAEGGEGLAMLDDVTAACHLDGPQPWQDDRSYVIAADAGIVRDRTAAAVAHLEETHPDDPTPPRVVVDRLMVWAGSKKNPVELQDVEDWLRQAWESYKRPPLIVDPWQMVSTIQSLRRDGVRVREFAFSTGASKLAGALYSVLRERRIDLPRDPELVKELQTVRVIETAPGRLKLDNPSGTHDDMATAIGLAALSLIERGDTNRGIQVINLRDMARTKPTAVRGGITLEGSQYFDRDSDGKLVPPPGWDDVTEQRSRSRTRTRRRPRGHR